VDHHHDDGDDDEQPSEHVNGRFDGSPIDCLVLLAMVVMMMMTSSRPST